MQDTINFIDLVALSRITPEATVERFGGLINSSFFDASNILGTLKQKGLVDFITSFPSQSALTITQEGKQLLDEAHQKSTLPIDMLDMAALSGLSNGRRSLPDLASSINVTPKDLALRLYKLSEQKFISYELRNGSINMALTEKGFLQVKDGSAAPAMPVQQPAQAQVVPGQPAPMQQQASDPPATPEAPKTEAELKQLEVKIVRAKRMKSFAIFAIIVIVVIIFVFLYMTGIV
jgi:hypothetical protein